MDTKTTFETITRDSFEALESKQAQLVLARLDVLMLQLEEMERFLNDYMREKETVHQR